VTGDGPPREVESPAPITTGRGAGARRRDVSGGICERRGGAGGHYCGAPRTLEEEETGLLQLEVSGTFRACPEFRGPVLTLVLSHSLGGAARPCPRERYGRLTQFSNERDWYRDLYDSLTPSWRPYGLTMGGWSTGFRPCRASSWTRARRQLKVAPRWTW
jgi:hypothetical protein